MTFTTVMTVMTVVLWTSPDFTLKLPEAGAVGSFCRWRCAQQRNRVELPGTAGRGWEPGEI
jgi:hypothetical protein